MRDADHIIDSDMEERPLKPALRRGWRGRCPRCGSGPIFDGYLTVRHDCSVCNQPLHHHRADDGPAWLTMLVAGKLMAPLMVLLFETYRLGPLAMIAALVIPFVILSLWLLPRIKGGFIAFQWAKRMHGFGTPQRGYGAEGGPDGSA